MNKKQTKVFEGGGSGGRKLFSKSFLPPVPRLPTAFGSWREVMDVALREAFAAGESGEAPVGAAVFSPEGELLGLGRNASIAVSDPTAHAEVVAMRRAAQRLGNYRLTGCLLAVTLEPCLMCAGTMVHARLGGLVFGARDPKAGAVVSRMEALALDFHNHRVPWIEGVMAEECGAVLTRFFTARRKNSKSER